MTAILFGGRNFCGIIVSAATTMALLGTGSNSRAQGNMLGSRIEMQCYDPNFETQISTSPVAVVRAGKVTFPDVAQFEAPGADLVNDNVDVSGTSVSISFTGLFGNFATAPVNTYVLTELDRRVPAFTGFTIDTAVTTLAIQPSQVTFTAHQLFINVSGLSFNSSTFARFNVTFAPVVTGIYNGESGEGTGYVTVTLGGDNRFTGKLILNGTKYSLRGKFDNSGSYVGSAKPTLPVLLQIITPGGANAVAMMTGTAGGVGLTAYHAAYGAGETAAEAGNYTLLLSATAAESGIPPGSGYATLTVGKSGGASLAGKLADGTSFSDSTIVVGGSTGNQCVFYNALSYRSVSPKGAKGMLIGDFTFGEPSASGLDGTLYWLKPQQSAGRYAPAIDTDLAIAGSVYVFKSGDIVLPGFVSGTLELSDTGTLSLSGSTELDKDVTLTTANTFTITNPGMDDLKLKVDTKTGFISGKFIYPGDTKPTAFGGVVLQDGTDGGGYFLGPNGSGNVNLGMP